MLHGVLVAALALAGVQAQCQLKLKKNTGDLVCGERGSTKPHSVYRIFYAPTYQNCMLRCTYDPSCYTVEYDTRKGRCATSDQRIRLKKGFKKNPKSRLVYGNALCYNRPVNCGTLNPSFENPPVNKNGVVAKPKQFANGVLVSIDPWLANVFTAEGKDMRSRSTVRVVDNSKLPAGAKRTPAGSKFVIFNAVTPPGTGQADSTVMFSLLSLKNKTNYRLSFLYSYISFTGNESTTAPTIYYLSGNAGSQTPISLQLDMKDGDNDGVWRTASGTFRFSNATDAADAAIAVFLQTPGGGDGAPVKSVFGIDNIRVQELS